MGSLPTKTPPTEVFTLDALLAAYSKRFPLSAAALNACRFASRDPELQTVHIHHVRTGLAVGTPPSLPELRLAFLRRLNSAVYFGDTAKDLFNLGSLKAYLGRVPGFKPLTNADDQQMRMVVGGKVFVSPKYLPFPSFKVSVVSLYAPNCESTATSDYQRLFAAGHFDADTYVDILNATITTAVKMAAIDLKHTAVALPAVGLGAYATHIPRKDVPNLVYSLVDSFVDVCRHYSVRPLIFPYGHDRTAQAFAAAAREWAIDVSEGDLFKAPEVAHRLGGNDVAIINAWDTRSLIGNGLLADPTVDGFMASGGGPGATLPNSSFYHNVVVIKAALADAWRSAAPKTARHKPAKPAVRGGRGGKKAGKGATGKGVTPKGGRGVATRGGRGGAARRGRATLVARDGMPVGRGGHLTSDGTGQRAAGNAVRSTTRKADSEPKRPFAKQRSVGKRTKTNNPSRGEFSLQHRSKANDTWCMQEGKVAHSPDRRTQSAGMYPSVPTPVHAPLVSSSYSKPTALNGPEFLPPSSAPAAHGAGTSCREAFPSASPEGAPPADGAASCTVS